MKKNIFICLALASILLASCSARVNGALNSDGSAELSLRASLEPRMAALIRSLSRLNASPSASDNVIDGPAIASSMSAAPGVRAVSFQNVNPTTIEGNISISQVNDFLAVSGNQNFILYRQTGANGRFTITLNRNTGPQIVAMMSPDVAAYLSALMAPVATGEALSRNEYLALVRSVYGRPIADEISAARINVSIAVPQNISAIRGGVISSTARNRGEFDIPLIDLLVLENTLVYELSW